MLLPHNTIVAVADGQSLSLFRNVGTEAAPSLAAVESPALHVNGHGSGVRHRSSTANPDDRRQEEDGYAASVARWLNREILSGRIGHLMMIATPKTLGELRLHYHRGLQGKLVGEIAKELSGRSAAVVEAAIAAAR